MDPIGLALALVLAALGGPMTVLLSIALVRPRQLLAFLGRGKGDDLTNAVRGVRLFLAVALFSAAFATGALTAFMSRLATP